MQAKTKNHNFHFCFQFEEEAITNIQGTFTSSGQHYTQCTTLVWYESFLFVIKKI